PVASVPFPLYEGYRIGAPRVPAATRGADLVHVHTPFSVGVAVCSVLCERHPDARNDAMANSPITLNIFIVKLLI
ncbi:MAG: hypothetical protein ABEN55_04710, partial [Bradymonadaceae bacterium]